MLYITFRALKVLPKITLQDFINRRKMTEFGNIGLVEDREENEGGKIAIRLPGVRSGDMASRSMKPEVRIYSLQFCPTGTGKF